MSQYNDIKITPNIGVSSNPKIEFIGAGNSTITLKVLDAAYGGIIFEGQQAEILSLVDVDVSFGSSVASFSVNDFYGVPQIQSYNDGRVLVAPYGAQTVGIGTTNPTSEIDIRGNVNVVGVITATDFNSTSDIQYKDNIQTIENSLDKIVSIRGVSFEWKKDNRKSLGVIAQEVESVFPELVNGNDYKTVNYNGLIGVLIESIKELKQEVEDLKKQINS